MYTLALRVLLHIGIYTYFEVYTSMPGKLRALLHDCLPTLEPGTRSRISARCMAPGRETPRARRGGAPRPGVAGRVLLATCAPRVCASRFLRKPEEFRFRGLGPLRMECVRGVALVRRAGPGDVQQFLLFGRNRVCIKPVSLHRVEGWILGDRTSSNSTSQSGTCLRGGTCR